MIALTYLLTLVQFAGCNIIFFDAGTYVVSSTLTVPAGTQMVGEVWSVIAGKGSAFQDMNNPQPVVQVGESGSQGLVEITDIIFSTIGPSTFVKTSFSSSAVLI
jgi:hypothetical protein